MKSLSASIGAIVLACLMLSACSKKEEAVPQEPQKTEVQEPKVEVPPPPKEEEPDLVPLGSLSEEKAEAPAPEQVEKTNTSGVEQQSSGEYVIQVSIQSSKRAANAIVKKLAEQGITAYVAEVENPGELEGTFYRVRIGYFPTVASAQEYGQQVLSSLNYAGWIDMKKNDHVGTPNATDSEG